MPDLKRKIEEVKRGELTDLPIEPVKKVKDAAEKVLPSKR